MKKTIFSIMFAMILGMVACTGNNTSDVATDTDTVVVDSVLAVDSIVLDTLEAVTVDTVCAE